MVTTQENKEQNICAIHVIIRKATQGWPPSAATRPSRTTRADFVKTVTISHIILKNLEFRVALANAKSPTKIKPLSDIKTTNGSLTHH